MKKREKYKYDKRAERNKIFWNGRFIVHNESNCIDQMRMGIRKRLTRQKDKD